MEKERIEGAIIEEPEQAPASSWVLVSQFFIVPVVIIALCVGIFILFGLITGETRSARDYLEEVKAGKGSRRWQAAFELSKYLNYRDNTKADSRLARDIIYALRHARDDDPRVRQYLALALGKLHDRSAVEPLVEFPCGRSASLETRGHWNLWSKWETTRTRRYERPWPTVWASSGTREPLLTFEPR